MVFFKYLIFCSLLIFQAQAYPQEPVNHPFAEVAKEFLVASEKLVDATLDLADTVVNILADDAGTLQETLGMVVVKVENVIWPSIQGIDEKVTNRNIKKALTCVAANKDNINNLINSDLRDISMCITPNISSIFIALKPIIATLKLAQDGVETSLGGVDNCKGSNGEQLDCVLNLIPSAVKTLVEPAKELLAELPAVIDTLINLIRNISPCVGPVLSTSFSKLALIALKIYSCLSV